MVNGATVTVVILFLLWAYESEASSGGDPLKPPPRPKKKSSKAGGSEQRPRASNFNLTGQQSLQPPAAVTSGPKNKTRLPLSTDLDKYQKQLSQLEQVTESRLQDDLEIQNKRRRRSQSVSQPPPPFAPVNAHSTGPQLPPSNGGGGTSSSHSQSTDQRNAYKNYIVEMEKNHSQRLRTLQGGYETEPVPPRMEPPRPLPPLGRPSPQPPQFYPPPTPTNFPPPSGPSRHTSRATHNVAYPDVPYPQHLATEPQPQSFMPPTLPIYNQNVRGSQPVPFIEVVVITTRIVVRRFRKTNVSTLSELFSFVQQKFPSKKPLTAAEWQADLQFANGSTLLGHPIDGTVLHTCCRAVFAPAFDTLPIPIVVNGQITPHGGCRISIKRPLDTVDFGNPIVFALIDVALANQLCHQTLVGVPPEAGDVTITGWMVTHFVTNERKQLNSPYEIYSAYEALSVLLDSIPIE